MRRMAVLVAALAVAIVVIAPTSLAKAMNYKADLSGDNEVPPVVTEATGKAKVKIKGETVHFRVHVRNLSSAVVGAHIHMGPADDNGPVLVNLIDNATKMKASNGKWKIKGSFPLEIAPDLASLIEEGNAYVNVHTVSVGSGEVRGQLG